MQDEFSRNTGRTSDDTTTCEPSRPAIPTNGESMPSAAGSPARISLLPEGELDSTGTVLGCGLSSLESFACFDPDTQCWRTSQVSLFGDSAEFSEPWPKSGMTRNGRCYRLSPLAPRISDLVSSFLQLWPTPSAGNPNDGEDLKNWQLRREREKTKGRNGNGFGMPLAIAVQIFHTPTTNDAKNLTLPPSQVGRDSLVADMIRLYPTPRADGRDNCGGSNSRRSAKRAGTYIGRKLNPQFVEWLMGFPVGWTDCEPSETLSCPPSPNGSDTD